MPPARLGGSDQAARVASAAAPAEAPGPGPQRDSSRSGDATRQLERYRVGRVLFAGDAAHIHPPLGDQGLNLGTQDAFDLGWNPAAAVQDRRRPVCWTATTPNGIRSGPRYRTTHRRSGCRARPSPDEDLAALRGTFVDLLRLPDTHRHLAVLMSGLSLRHELSGKHPLTGQRVPDTDLVTAAGPPGCRCCSSPDTRSCSTWPTQCRPPPPAASRSRPRHLRRRPGRRCPARPSRRVRLLGRGHLRRPRRHPHEDAPSRVTRARPCARAAPLRTARAAGRGAWWSAAAIRPPARR